MNFPVLRGQLPKFGAPPPGSGPVDYKGFARVIDGDSLEVYIDGRQTAVGILGIKAPKGLASCAVQATTLLQQLVKGGLWFKEDPKISFDERKRRMYYVQLRDGRSLAKELVKNGVALPDGSGNEASDLADLARTARGNLIGCLNSIGHPGPQADRGDFRESGEATAAPSLQPRASTPTGGFAEQVVVSGLTSPTAFAFLPDGRIVIAQKNGVIRVFKNGALLATPLLDISGRVNSYWDHGLIGMAPDANFAGNGFLYVGYTYENDANQVDGTKTARVSRFTVVGDTASPNSETVLLGTQVGSTCANFAAGADCIPSESMSHSVGAIQVDSAGNVFVTTGDGAYFNVVDDQALRAQDLNSLGGKLLRITGTGAGLSTNPFWDGNASHNRSKVWAYGMRNPFRFALRPGSGIPFIGDVGWDTWEEINVTSVGANLGWPCYEGNFQQAGYQPKPVCQTLYGQGPSAVRGPVWNWNHNSLSSASVSGAFYTGTTYPAQYQGAFFFADYAQSIIRYFQADASNNITSGPFDFAYNADGPVQMVMGPDQSLYYVAIVTGEVRKFVYTGPDSTPPTVTVTSPPASGTGVSVNPTVTASFSEGLQSATINGATFLMVRQSTGGAVTATVTYNPSSNSATLIPSNSLLPSTAYTVTVKGASSGIKDLAGNAMSADYNWTFTTTSLTPPPSGTTALSSLEWSFMSNGWGPVEKDKSNGEQFAGDGQQLSIRGTKYTKGLGGHASSEVRYYLGGVCSSFTTSLGIDDEAAPNGNVVFQILGDGAVLYDSGAVTGAMAAKTATVNVGGKNELTLRINDGGDGINFDHGDWANPQITCSTGNSPPTATISTPSPSFKYKVGDTITFSGSGTDSIDGPLPASALSWQIILHHCPGGICHTHFFLNTSGVASGTFTVPDHGDDSYFEIVLTATNRRSQTGSASVSIQPQTVLLTLASSPSNLKVVYGGIEAITPVSYTTVVGSAHTIFASSPQGNQSFTSWSDGGAQQHNVIVGTSNVTFAAIFGTGSAPPGVTYLSDLTWTAMSNGWGPVEKDKSNGEQGAGDGRTISIRGATYAKGLGAHAASDVQYSLGGSCSAFDAIVGIDDEVAPSGRVNFRVLADGATLYDSGPVTGSMAGLNVNVNISGKSTLELVVTDGGDGANYDHADWANARITCAGTAPPTVSAVTPVSGASGISVGSAVTAAFSGGMNPASISASTFTLVRQGTTTTLTATVTYNSATNTATLQPSAKLLLGTTYTATVKGGTSGVQSSGGMPMTSDFTWNFTTMPSGTTFVSSLPFAFSSNGWGPAERDLSNGEQPANDGHTIAIRTSTFAKGLGVHAPSDIRVNVDGACSNFSATIGIDNEVAPNGSVVFQIFGDSTQLFTSATLNGSSAPQNVSVNISGRNVLRLVVTDSGNGNAYDHADWGDARITCP